MKCFLISISFNSDSENSKHDGVSKIHTEINQSGSNSPQSSPPPTPTDSQIPDTNPILVSDLSHCISEKHSNMNAGFKKEFKVLINRLDNELIKIYATF